MRPSKLRNSTSRQTRHFIFFTEVMVDTLVPVMEILAVAVVVAEVVVSHRAELLHHK